MTNYKAERRAERKERRKAAARQDHREKEEKRAKQLKEQNKDKPKKQTAWKRKDKNGNIILWNAVKITKTSGYILGAMATIIILFAVSPIFEDPNYVEPERMSFAECEAIGFNDAWCLMDYKHCREYADGGRICEYAEENPFVDYDIDENRWTPEEQDFLPPPQQFILPFAFGQLDENGLAFVEDDLPSTPEALTLLIDEIKLDIERTEDDMIKIEREIQEWRIEEQKLRNERFVAESKKDDAEDDYEEAKRKYRHAQDMIIRSNDDIREQDEAYDDYKTKTRIFDQAEKEYFRAMERYDQGVDEHLKLKNKLIELEDKLDDLLEKLTKAKTKMNLVFRDYQFINVNLSKTCQTLIKYDLNTKCPTYREMVPLFDNTLPKISGAFVEVGYDIKRLPSPLSEHWKFYEQMTMTKVVSVDADPELFDRGINITIQAKDFTMVEDTGRKDKTASYDSSTMEQTTWHNIFVDDRCSQVTVGPDLKAIEAAILHVLNKCTTDLSEFTTVKTTEPTIIPKEQSMHWNYIQWITELVASLRDDSNTK